MGIPPAFVPNHGQYDREVLFHSIGAAPAVALTRNSVVLYGVCRDSTAGASRTALGLRAVEAGRDTGWLRLSHVAANPAARPLARGALGGRVNYLLGNDPVGWVTDVPTYSSAAVKDLYPGVDAEFVWRGTQLETRYVVQPGARPEAVQWNVDGSEVSCRGTLAGGAPQASQGPQHVAVEAWQLGLTGLQGVPARLRQGGLQPDSRLPGAAEGDSRAGSLGLWLGDYDRGLPVWIQPRLDFATTIGGSKSDYVEAVTSDGQGFVYAAGWSKSFDFPVEGGIPHPSDGFVAKLDVANWRAVYVTLIGGSGTDSVEDIQVDARGRVYVTGYTSSWNFPSVGGFQPRPGGDFDGFVLRLAGQGNGVEYASFLGGSQYDTSRAIAVDAAGRAYLAGNTWSDDMPMVRPRMGPSSDLSGCTGYNIECGDAFVATVSESGSELEFSTYLGGSARDGASGIAVRRDSSVLVSGYTNSADFPTAGATETHLHPGQCYNSAALELVPCLDVFVAYLSDYDQHIIWSRYLGGGAEDVGLDLALEGRYAYITGRTGSDDFPVLGALQARFGGGVCQDGTTPQFPCPDAFVTSVDVIKGGLVYSTYLGGGDRDVGWSIDADRRGRVAVAGWSISSDFPVANAIQAERPGTTSAFASLLETGGSELLLSTYLGGSRGEIGYAVDVVDDGTVCIGGASFSRDFPDVPPIWPRGSGLDEDGFVACIALRPSAEVYLPWAAR